MAKENSRKGAKTQRMPEHEIDKTIDDALAALGTWRENEIFLNNAPTRNGYFAGT